MKIDRGENSPRIIQGSAEFSQSSTSFRALSELECIKNYLLLLNWPYAEILKTQLEVRSAQGSPVLSPTVTGRIRIIIAVHDETSL